MPPATARAEARAGEWKTRRRQDSKLLASGQARFPAVYVYFQLSSVSSSSRRIRPLGPRVQRHRVLDDNFLFTVRDSLREYSFYANNSLVTVPSVVADSEMAENCATNDAMPPKLAVSNDSMKPGCSSSDKFVIHPRGRAQSEKKKSKEYQRQKNPDRNDP